MIEFSTDTLLFAVGNLEGMPAVTNVISRPFAVTDSWKVSMDEVPENALSVTGELVFGEGSTLSLENAVLFRSGADGASGEVKCPGKEMVRVTLLLPEGKKVTSASHPYDAEGRVVRLRLAPVRKSTVEWKIECGTIADKE